MENGAFHECSQVQLTYAIPAKEIDNADKSKKL
jgi:hypothetical protein